MADTGYGARQLDLNVAFIGDVPIHATLHLDAQSARLLKWAAYRSAGAGAVVSLDTFGEDTS